MLGFNQKINTNTMENQKKINRTFNELNRDELVSVNGGSNWPPLGPIPLPDIIRGNDNKPEK